MARAGRPSPADPPRVSVIMVAYRTGPSLFTAIPRVLADLLVQELVLVDNGSAPEDAAKLREIAASEPRLRLLQGHGNIGFARGCNLGAGQAKSGHLLILNPDAYLQPGCIAALIAGAEGFASPCIVGARVLNTDGSEQRGARRGEVTLLSTVLSLSGLTRLAPFHGFEIHRDGEVVPAGPITVPTISGACFLISLADFDALGGFDEGYFLHVEDIDLCWRARRMGGSVVFQPTAEVLHEGSTSASPKLKVEFHKSQGLIRYFFKRADNPISWIAALALSPMIMSAALARPLLRGLLGPVRGRLS
ncbi:MAG TPA: glycosyltransferase family 2 protein [Caulobacteraceae bacterium]|nr:glycosyltransferase family 2 protein [Caulobacteraceae bacterium]